MTRHKMEAHAFTGQTRKGAAPMNDLVIFALILALLFLVLLIRTRLRAICIRSRNTDSSQHGSLQ